VKRVLRAWHSGGLRKAAGVVLDRILDGIADGRLGIATRGLVRVESLVADYTDCHDYFPTSWRAFRRLMAEVPVEAGHDVFVDYGAGKGRAVLMAAEYPFRAILGVELSPALVSLARRNVAACRGRLRCRQIGFWTGSAEQFPVPPEATVLYFYNPFHGAVLRAVLDAIDRSRRDHPRRISLVFNNPVHFEKIAADYAWLVPRRRFEFEHTCVIYEATPAATAVRLTHEGGCLT